VPAAAATQTASTASVPTTDHFFMQVPLSIFGSLCPSVDSAATAAGLLLTRHERPVSSGRGRAPASTTAP